MKLETTANSATIFCSVYEICFLSHICIASWWYWGSSSALCYGKPSATADTTFLDDFSSFSHPWSSWGCVAVLLLFVPDLNLLAIFLTSPWPCFITCFTKLARWPGLLPDTCYHHTMFLWKRYFPKQTELEKLKYMVSEARAGSQTACLNQLKTSHSTLLFKLCFQSPVLTPPLGATFFVSNVCQHTLWLFLQHLCVHSILNLETTFFCGGKWKRGQYLPSYCISQPLGAPSFSNARW